MRSAEEASYRLRLAEGFLAEARQDMGLQRWRSCVDASQLAVENAAKAVLALTGPVGRTHSAGLILRQAIDENRLPDAACEGAERIAECAKLLGRDVHVETDYGDEAGWRTPWELFDEADAERTLHLAEEAVSLAGQIVQRSGGL